MSDFECVCVFVAFLIFYCDKVSRFYQFFLFAAGMNGFLKAEFSNMWTAILQNKKSFKRPISKFTFCAEIIKKVKKFLIVYPHTNIYNNNDQRV